MRLGGGKETGSGQCGRATRYSGYQRGWLDQILLRRASIRRKIGPNRPVAGECRLRAFEAALGATRDVATIKRREIREYLANLLKHRTAANRAHAAISAFFAWCADDEIEILDQSPAVGLRQPGGNESERDKCLDEKVRISIFGVRRWQCRLLFRNCTAFYR